MQIRTLALITDLASRAKVAVRTGERLLARVHADVRAKIRLLGSTEIAVPGAVYVELRQS